MNNIRIFEKDELIELEEKLNEELKILTKDKRNSNFLIKTQFFNNDFDDLEKCVGTIMYDSNEEETDFNTEIEVILIQDFYSTSLEQRVNGIVREKCKDKKTKVRIDTQFIANKSDSLNSSKDFIENYFASIIISKKVKS